MDNTYDDLPPELADAPILGGTPADTTETATETTAEPVQPAAPSGSQTDKPSEDGSTPSQTDNSTENAPASADKGDESNELQEGRTPEPQGTETSNPQYAQWIERQRTKALVNDAIKQDYAPPTEQDFVDQGLSPELAAYRAELETIRFERESARVAELNAGMRDEAVQIQQSFDVFNPNSPNYDADFATRVGESYKQYARLQTDESSGIILSADVPLYDYYKQQADLYNTALSKGQQRAQANTEQMIARTENPGGSTSSTKRASELSDEEFLAQYGDMPLF